MDPTRLRVLIGEDDAGLAAVFSQVLAGAGFHVVCVGDAESVVRLAAQEPFAAVVCDYALPGGDGLAVLKELAAANPSLVRKFILSTGAADDPRCRAFAEIRPERALFKPFPNADLVAAVRLVVEADLPVDSPTA